MRLLIVPVLLVLTLLGGCSSSPRYGGFSAPDPRAALRSDLHEQYRIWAGTPYRLGGIDRRGIDCSGLVYRVYRDLYGLQLPRRTEAQADLGRKVAADELQTADLVFFKTGWRTRHVGIYIGQGRFLHASTSRGVVISALNNPYWQRHYWTARRLPLSGI